MEVGWEKRGSWANWVLRPRYSLHINCKHPANIQSLNWHREDSTKRETVAKMHNTQ
jgi:hypothetical protein